jgi:hypothetical protein
LHLFRALSSFCGAPSIEQARTLVVTVLFGLIPSPTFSKRSSSSPSRRRAHHLHLCAAALIVFTFAPPRPSSSSSRHHAHHLHLCATALIVFTFAPPRPSSSSSRRRAHHLHLRAAALITFIFAPPCSSSSPSRRCAHHLLCAAALTTFIFAQSRSSCFRPSIFIRLAAQLGKFHPPAPPSLHSFGGSRRLHCRDAISSFGRQRHRAAISSFVRPAH